MIILVGPVLIFLWVAFILIIVYNYYYPDKLSEINIPRVYVLCAPTNVQFTYEIILRVGLPSSDFDVSKHEIDVTLMGGPHKELLPVTRVGPIDLATNLLVAPCYIVMYRLTQLIECKSIILAHTGPTNASIYVYDLEIFEPATGERKLYAINACISCIPSELALKDISAQGRNLFFPIHDVPYPNLTFIELLMTWMLIFSLSGVLVFAVELIKYFYSHLNIVNYVIASLIVALTASVVAGAWIFILRAWVKQKESAEAYFNENLKSRYTYIRYVLYGAIMAMSFGLTAGAIVLEYQATQRDFRFKDDGSSTESFYHHAPMIMLLRGTGNNNYMLDEQYDTDDELKESMSLYFEFYVLIVMLFSIEHLGLVWALVTLGKFYESQLPDFGNLNVAEKLSDIKTNSSVMSGARSSGLVNARNSTLSAIATYKTLFDDPKFKVSKHSKHSSTTASHARSSAASNIRDELPLRQ